MSPPPPVIQMRSGQRRLFQLVEQYRLLGFIARRQYGKTTTCANIALMKMMKHRDHTVIFGSAKLNLSREIVRKEAAAPSSRRRSRRRWRASRKARCSSPTTRPAAA